MKCELTGKQKEKIRLHRMHHTPEHMKKMESFMKHGKCFDVAHEMAMKKVGK